MTPLAVYQPRRSRPSVVDLSAQTLAIIQWVWVRCRFRRVSDAAAEQLILVCGNHVSVSMARSLTSMASPSSLRSLSGLHCRLVSDCWRRRCRPVLGTRFAALCPPATGKRGTTARFSGSVCPFRGVGMGLGSKTAVERGDEAEVL